MMNDKMIVPNFLLTVDETDSKEGVYETSYVEYPATGLDFLAFSETPTTPIGFKTLQFANGVDYQRITSGVWMAPDTKYPKQSSAGDFYTVEFKKEDLYKALVKYLKSGNADSIKVEHSGSYLDGFTSLEHWIIQDADTKSPVLGLSLSDLGYSADNIPVGTIMKSTYVADQLFWNEQILSGKVKGYSIGGLFAFEPDTASFAKTEWNHKELFTAMGINQDGGEVILKDNSILVLKDTISVNNEPVKEGTFSTTNGWTIVVREGTVVDYSFSDIDVVVEVAVVEPTVEVTTEVAAEVAAEDTVVIEQPTNDVQEAAPVVDKMDAILARMIEIEAKLSLVNTDNALKDETIALLKEEADTTAKTLKKANDELGKQPIKKPATNTTSLKQEVSKPGKQPLRVGNRTIQTSARTHII